MEQPVLDLVRSWVSAYVECAPGHWIRLVAWCARLQDEDDENPAFMRAEVAVTYDGSALGQRYLAVDPLAVDPSELEDLIAGTADEGWTLLRIEVDRDGQERIELGGDRTFALEDSASDPAWDEVHDYLERNRPQLQDLVERLRGSGHLPGPSDVTAVDPATLPPGERGSLAVQPNARPARERRGVLGRIFGSR